MPERTQLLRMSFELLRGHALLLTNSNRRASDFFESVRSDLDVARERQRASALDSEVVREADGASRSFDRQELPPVRPHEVRVGRSEDVVEGEPIR